MLLGINKCICILIRESILQEDSSYCVCTSHQSVILSEAKSYRNIRRNRWIHYHEWRLWHPCLRNVHVQWAADIVEFNNTIKQLDIIDICRLFSNNRIYIYMQHSPHATFTTFWTIKHLLTKLEEQKSHNIWSVHSGVKLEINNRKIIGKYPKIYGF